MQHGPVAAKIGNTVTVEDDATPTGRTEEHDEAAAPGRAVERSSMAATIALPPAMRAPVVPRGSAVPPAPQRWSRRRGVSGVVAAIGAFGVAAACVIGPTGAAVAESDADTGRTVFASAVAAPQSLVVQASVESEGGIEREGYTAYVTPTPTPTPTPTQSAQGSSGGGGGGTGWAPPAVTPDPGSAQAIAFDMVMGYGWGQADFDCLVALWHKESGWRVNAYNASSGAYGIPQSLPGNKMASAGADWETNAATQISWGLGYISGRYGTPCGAWGHSQSVGWY